MKADYGAVPLAEAKAELVDDANLRPAPQEESQSRRRKGALLIVGILLILGWLIFRRNHNSPTKGSATQPLVVPQGPPVTPSGSNDAPEPLAPKGPKSDKKASKQDPKKASPKKIPFMKESKKGPKSPKGSPKKKNTKSMKTKSKKRN